MSNLEELTLFLSVLRFNSTFIDGKELNDDILCSMTQLQKFSFNIHTQLINDAVQIPLPSSNDIRNDFFQLGYNDIDTFGDVNFVNNRANCHIYSLPSQFKRFFFMVTAFQGGKSDQVRVLVMYDRRPFEHRLFQIIARDFPFLQQLFLTNLVGQQAKDHSCELITFSHLLVLSLPGAHTDYVREFLYNENIALPRLTSLSITYEALATVTNNFTNNEARRVCSRITEILICEPFVRPNNFHLYFLLVKIDH